MEGIHRAAGELCEGEYDSRGGILRQSGAFLTEVPLHGVLLTLVCTEVLTEVGLKGGHMKAVLQDGVLPRGVQWNLGNVDLTNDHILEFVINGVWQASCCLATRTAKHELTSRELLGIAMREPRFVAIAEIPLFA